MPGPQETIGITGAAGAAAYWGYNKLTLFPAAVNNAANFFASEYGASVSALKRVFKGIGFGTISEKIADNRVKTHMLLHQKYAGQMGFDPAISMGIEWVESTGIPTKLNHIASSGDYAVGLMQVTLTSARQYVSGINISQLQNPETNIMIGCSIFKAFHDASGNIEDALNMYNSGKTMEQLNLFYEYVVLVLKKYYDFATLAASKVITTTGLDLSAPVKQPSATPLTEQLNLPIVQMPQSFDLSSNEQLPVEDQSTQVADATQDEGTSEVAGFGNLQYYTIRKGNRVLRIGY
jgi:hypothetical protein